MRYIAILLASSLLFLANTPAHAADATLNNEQVRRAVAAAFSSQPGIRVVGVLEIPQSMRLKPIYS
jgi:hypothetical protein